VSPSGWQRACDIELTATSQRYRCRVADRDVAERYRAAWPRMLGRLVREFGQVELAEDCLQEACLRALGRPEVRDAPAWILTTARRLMLDTRRHEAVGVRKAPMLVDHGAASPGSPTGDDRLDLLVLACQPVLPPASRMPLALRFVVGASTEDIADAFLVRHTAMSARLTRAKRLLDDTGRTLTVPDAAARSEVLSVISVLYTLGHTAVSGASLGRPGDRRTAIELARAARAAWPDEREATGLLALLLLTEARTEGRTVDGRATTLRTADRRRWDGDAIGEGLELATGTLPTMGRFALQAGIAGLHSSAPSWEATDWQAIVVLYDRLVERWPSPSAQVARAVAVGYATGADVGLAALEAVPCGEGALTRQHHLARADLLSLAGRTHEARAAYGAARALERNAVLQEFLDDRLAGVEEVRCSGRRRDPDAAGTVTSG
jgi:RNA polymerase sigma-70 factor (ECF subfamily)